MREKIHRDVPLWRFVNHIRDAGFQKWVNLTVVDTPWIEVTDEIPEPDVVYIDEPELIPEEIEEAYSEDDTDN